MIEDEILDQFAAEDSFSKNLKPLNSRCNKAFLDAEFNCDDVCSVGIVFCDKDYKLLDKYYAEIKPVVMKDMPKEVESITKLSYSSISNGTVFEDACNAINELCKKHKIKSLQVWGNRDQSVFLNTKKSRIKQLKGRISKRDERWTFITQITDICPAVSSYFFQTQNLISLANLSLICDVVNQTEHNALSDAMCLFQCMKHIYQENIDESIKELYMKFDKQKVYYHACRRAERKRIKIINNLDIDPLELSADLKKLYQMDASAKAYIDDGIRLGIISSSLGLYDGFPEFTTYIKQGGLF